MLEFLLCHYLNSNKCATMHSSYFLLSFTGKAEFFWYLSWRSLLWNLSTLLNLVSFGSKAYFAILCNREEDKVITRFLAFISRKYWATFMGFTIFMACFLLFGQSFIATRKMMEIVKKVFERANENKNLPCKPIYLQTLTRK